MIKEFCFVHTWALQLLILVVKPFALLSTRFLWFYLANIQESICRTTRPLVYGYVKNEQAIMNTPIQEIAEYNLLTFIASVLRVTDEELLFKIAQCGPCESFIAFKGTYFYIFIQCTSLLPASHQNCPHYAHMPMQYAVIFKSCKNYIFR